MTSSDVQDAMQKLFCLWDVNWVVVVGIFFSNLPPYVLVLQLHEREAPAGQCRTDD